MEKSYITISIYTEFLQEALFSMKFKCKDLIGKKEVDFCLCEKLVVAFQLLGLEKVLIKKKI